MGLGLAGPDFGEPAVEVIGFSGFGLEFRFQRAVSDPVDVPGKGANRRHREDSVRPGRVHFESGPARNPPLQLPAGCLESFMLHL